GAGFGQAGASERAPFLLPARALVAVPPTRGRPAPRRPVPSLALVADDCPTRDHSHLGMLWFTGLLPEPPRRGDQQASERGQHEAAGHGREPDRVARLLRQTGRREM